MKGRKVWCLWDLGAESTCKGGAVALYPHPHPGFLRWDGLSSVLVRCYSFVNMCQYWKCHVSERATRIIKAVVYCCRNKIQHSRIFSQHQSSFWMWNGIDFVLLVLYSWSDTSQQQKKNPSPAPLQRKKKGKKDKDISNNVPGFLLLGAGVKGVWLCVCFVLFCFFKKYMYDKM